MRAGVHAPADMAHPEGVAITPRRHVFPHMQCIYAVTFDCGDKIVLDGKFDLAGQIGFEGQVHVADPHHDPAIHCVLSRKGQAQPARPMRNRSGRGAKARRATTGRVAQINRQVRADGRGYAHLACLAQHLDADFNARRMFGLRFGPFQNFGVFIGDDEQAGAASGFDLGPFRRVDHAFNRAIDNHFDQFQRLDHCTVALQGPTGARGFDRNRGCLRRGWHLDHAEFCAQIIKCQLCQMHQHRARLRFTDQRHLGARPNAVQRQNAAKTRQPFALDTLLQHRPLPMAIRFLKKTLLVS